MLGSGWKLPGSGAALKLKAEPGLRYEMVSQDSGVLVDGQRMLRRGKSLHVYLNNRRVLELDGFYETAPEGQAAAQYLIEAIGDGGRWIEGGASGLAQGGVPEAPLDSYAPYSGPGSQSGTSAVASTGATGASLSSGGAGPMVLAGLGLAALGGGGGGGGSAPPSAAPVSGTVVTGTFLGGPAMPGNGLSVVIYDLDGQELGRAKVSDSGTFTVNLGNYTGGIIAKLRDANLASDYFDEATAAPKSVGSSFVFMAVDVVTTTNTVVTLNINSATTLAAVKAGLSAYDGSGNIAGTNTAEKLAMIGLANGMVAQAASLSGTPTRSSAIATINVDGSANPSANAYGQFLAALSGVDEMNAGNMAATVHGLADRLMPDGSTMLWDMLAQSQLLTGAAQADVGPAGLAVEISPAAPSGAASFDATRSPSLSNLEPAVAVLLSPQQIAGIVDGSKIPVASLAVLSPAQVASFSGTALASFEPAQLAALSLQQLTSAQVDALSPAQIAGISPQALKSLNPAALASLDAAQMAALSAEQLAALSAAQLSALTAAQVSSIPVTALGQLSAAQLSALRPDMSTVQVQALSQIQAAQAIDAALADQLGAVDIDTLSPAAVGALKP
jgi:hypothetical protein